MLKQWFGKRRQEHFRVYSPLIKRIISVNFLAIIFLGLAFLYVGEYYREIISKETQLLDAEVNFLATLMDGRNEEVKASIISNLSRGADKQVILFGGEGRAVYDNQILQQEFQKGVRFATIPPRGNIVAELITIAEFILGMLPGKDKSELKTYIHSFSMRVEAYPDAYKAFQSGKSSVTLWKSSDGDLIFTAAAPIFTRQKLDGVLYIIKTGESVRESLVSIRWDMLKAFSVALVITILLSFYLSDTIARPLQKLAEAANQMRLSKKRKTDIPDYSQRMDEIGYLSETLHDLTKGLWDRMDAIEGFAADVAHELKNPLTSLKSAVETLLRVEDKERREKLMAVIRHDFERIDRLITDIAEASRVDAELSKADMDNLDLGKMLTDIVDHYRTQKNGIVVEAHVDPERLFLVKGNAVRLQQVFHNVIDNAISFSPDGGVVELDIKGEDKTITVTIRDEGGGIPNDDFDKIFKRFYTERPDKHGFGKHSGLGLSIARQIVEAHGGTIAAKNILGRQGRIVKGACFTIVLPKFDLLNKETS